MSYKKTLRGLDLEGSADNGLIDRRVFLAAGGTTAGLGYFGSAIAGELNVEQWMTVPGSPFAAYGMPSRFEDKVVRTASAPPNAPGTGAARTPLHLLQSLQLSENAYGFTAAAVLALAFAPAETSLGVILSRLSDTRWQVEVV